LLILDFAVDDSFVVVRLAMIRVLEDREMAHCRPISRDVRNIRCSDFGIARSQFALLLSLSRNLPQPLHQILLPHRRERVRAVAASLVALRHDDRLAAFDPFDFVFENP